MNVSIWQVLWQNMAVELWLTLIGFIIFTVDLLFPRLPKRRYGELMLVGLIGSLALLIWEIGLWYSLPSTQDTQRYTDIAYWLTTNFASDQLAMFFKVAIIVGAILVSMTTVDYVEKKIQTAHAEFYGFIVFSVLALCFMASATELITLFLAIEFASISSYILAGYLSNEPKSAEAGIKYFLVGATTTAVSLYGMSLIYGTTGTTHLYEIAKKLEMVSSQFIHPLTLFGILLMLAMLGFKVAMVPFHGWAPDTYEGAPTPITAFLSVASKAAGMVALLRVLSVSFGPASSSWQMVLTFISVATMTFGNLGALWQYNLKRLMAYSSIAQVGYLLIGVASFTPSDWQILTGARLAHPTDMALAGILYYVLGYAFANMGAFSVIIWVENSIGSSDMDDYEGMMQISPIAATMLTISFLSLIGIPPLVGFFGKFFLFGAAIKAKMTWLAVIGVINSVISAFYYLEVVRRMFFFAPKQTYSIKGGFLVGSAAVIGVVGSFLFGIFVGPTFQWAQTSVFKVVTTISEKLIGSLPTP